MRHWQAFRSWKQLANKNLAKASCRVRSLSHLPERLVHCQDVIGRNRPGDSRSREQQDVQSLPSVVAKSAVIWAYRVAGLPVALANFISHRPPAPLGIRTGIISTLRRHVQRMDWWRSSRITRSRLKGQILLAPFPAKGIGAAVRVSVEE